ncbi:head GIN domain-containing protein [Sphingopyxis kveilinensis]|uniref:head GIN domain-containing protein n=1 Tax=Sphingopyxis kveilinensis TaxID=3114367 RepID=UPI0030CEAA29
MRNWTIAALPLALAMTVTGCSAEVTNDRKDAERTVDAGPTASQEFDLTGFTGVEVTGPDDVTIQRGKNFSVVARGPQAVIDELEIELDGNMLSIGRKDSNFRFNGDQAVKVTVVMPTLRAVRLTGSGAIDADAVEGDAVEAVVTGSGDLKVAALNGTRAKLRITGSGDLEIGGGTIGAGDYDVTGSGSIDAGGLAAKTLDVSIAGSGDVDAQASDSADISILGSGDATIGGGAKCSTRSLGSGDAICK